MLAPLGLGQPLQPMPLPAGPSSLSCFTVVGLIMSQAARLGRPPARSAIPSSNPRGRHMYAVPLQSLINCQDALERAQEDGRSTSNIQNTDKPLKTQQNCRWRAKPPTGAGTRAAGQPRAADKVFPLRHTPCCAAQPQSGHAHARAWLESSSSLPTGRPAPKPHPAARAPPPLTPPPRPRASPPTSTPWVRRRQSWGP